MKKELQKIKWSKKETFDSVLKKCGTTQDKLSANQLKAFKALFKAGSYNTLEMHHRHDNHEFMFDVDEDFNIIHTTGQKRDKKRLSYLKTGCTLS